MIGETVITIWHGNTKLFCIAKVKHKEQIDKSGIKQKGFFDSSNCILRIPTEKDLPISIGDYVRIGKHQGNSERNTDFIITEISKNIKGANPHYKVVCER